MINKRFVVYALGFALGVVWGLFDIARILIGRHALGIMVLLLAVIATVMVLGVLFA
jgi:hypothetical protein